MSIIDCKHLSISYEGRTIVSDVSFSISPGDYLCIVGENGSGKTTLMRTLLGLKKPDKGEVLFSDGCSVGGASDASCKRVHKIGYLPQKSYQLLTSGDAFYVGYTGFEVVIFDSNYGIV